MLHKVLPIQTHKEISFIPEDIKEFMNVSRELKLAVDAQKSAKKKTQAKQRMNTLQTTHDRLLKKIMKKYIYPAITTTAVLGSSLVYYFISTHYDPSNLQDNEARLLKIYQDQALHPQLSIPYNSFDRDDIGRIAEAYGIPEDILSSIKDRIAYAHFGSSEHVAIIFEDVHASARTRRQILADILRLTPLDPIYLNEGGSGVSDASRTSAGMDLFFTSRSDLTDSEKITIIQNWDPIIDPFYALQIIKKNTVIGMDEPENAKKIKDDDWIRHRSAVMTTRISTYARKGTVLAVMGKKHALDLSYVSDDGPVSVIIISSVSTQDDMLVKEFSGDGSVCQIKKSSIENTVDSQYTLLKNDVPLLVLNFSKHPSLVQIDTILKDLVKNSKLTVPEARFFYKRLIMDISNDQFNMGNVAARYYTQSTYTMIDQALKTGQYSSKKLLSMQDTVLRELWDNTYCENSVLMGLFSTLYRQRSKIIQEQIVQLKYQGYNKEQLLSTQLMNDYIPNGENHVLDTQLWYLAVDTNYTHITKDVFIQRILEIIRGGLLKLQQRKYRTEFYENL